jgi:hypothetical protein
VRRSFAKFVARLEEIDLRRGVESCSVKMHVTLRELYEGEGRETSIAAARRVVYLWLSKEGKGINEIARLFDRAPSGVTKLMREKGA